MHCNLRPTDFAPIVLGFNYQAYNAVMLSLGLGLGLKTNFFGLGLGLGLAVSGLGLGLGLALSGVGLGLGLEPLRSC